MSRGVLVPSQNPQLVTPTSTSYYGVGQYQSGQQQHGQAWPGVVDSPYYTSNGATSSMNNPQASPFDQSPYASQTPFSGYNSYTNTFPYDAPSYGRSDAYQQHESPAQEPQETPHASNRKRNRMAHRSSDVEPLTDVEDMIAQLKADIDASFTNEVTDCTSSEYTLGGNALVPLMRPSFGPYSEGGHQDLPNEFKRNQLENGGTEAGAGQVRDEDESQLESPSQPQNNPGEATQSIQGRDHSSAQEGETEITQSPAQSSPSAPSSTTDPFKTCPNALVSTILGISSEKIRSIVQRAASRGLLERISAHDGFRYQFNNAWSSRVDDNSLRFSYICRDSLQNKDRMAHVPSIAPLRKIKQSYDCKGSVSVKFSSTAGVIIVQYKHTAIHPKPAHNRPRETNRPSVPRGTSRPGARGAGPGRPLGSGRMRGSKRKHGDDAPLPEFMAQSPVVPFTPAQFPQQQIRERSLFELLQQSAMEMAAKGGTGQLGSTEMPWWGSS